MNNLHLRTSRMSRLGHAKKGDFDPETIGRLNKDPLHMS